MTKKHIRNSVIPVVLALLVALVLSCSNLLEPESPVIESGKGLVVLSVSTGDDSAGASTSIRTITPAEIPAFSRYELVFTKSGESDVTISNATGIAGAGVSQELAAGTWTATVRAYRQFIISSPEEYLAARGSETITVNAGAVTEKTVHIKPVPVTDTAPGIFTYKVTFPLGASGTLTLTGGASPISYTLSSGAEVSRELAPGYYNLVVSLTKGILTAGTSEKLHIYSGLESKAEYTFENTDFVQTVYLEGTFPARPGGVTLTGGTVTAYSDAVYTSPIEQAQTTIVSGATNWVVGVPAAKVGTSVYLKAELTGSDGKGYAGTGSAAVIEKGVRGITLTDDTVPADVTSLSGTLASGARVTLTWTDPTDADFDHIEITWSPDGATPVTVAKGTGTWTSSALTETEYTFTVKAVDTAISANKSGGQTVTKTPDGTVPADVTDLDGTPGDAELTLTWTDPPDADFDHIEISFSPTVAGITQPISVNKGALTTTITGLANKTAYTFTVKAVDEAGNKSAGETKALTPLAPTGEVTVEFSGLPQDETITLTGLGNTLSWAANTALTVSVSETFESYRWALDNTITAGETGNSLTLNAGDLSVKQHSLTALVTKDGVEYAKRVVFTVGQ
jgi:hypothetical protein